MKKSSGLSDKDKISITAILCALTVVVGITGGMLAEKQRGDMPTVEIIEINEDHAESEVSLTTAAETAGSADKADNKININTAAAEELDRLKGIGEKTAEAIIEYREETPFESIEDIMNVKGIGEKKFADIKNDICV